jgi:hypothetical protein
MEVEFDLTVDDKVRFNEYHCEHSPAIRRVKWFSILAGPIAMGLIGIVEYFRYESFTPLIIFWTLGILYGLAMPAYWRWSIRRRTRKLLTESPSGALTEHCTMRIDEQGVHATTNKGSSSLKWSAIEKVAQTEDAFYLYVGPVNAHVIPRRAFESRAAFEEFTSNVRRLREEAAGLAFLT